jgi:hypothetical protein
MSNVSAPSSSPFDNQSALAPIDIATTTGDYQGKTLSTRFTDEAFST